MPREARVHLVAMAVLTVSSLSLLRLVPTLPAWRMIAAAVLLALLIGGWATLLGLRLRRESSPGQRTDQREREGRAIVWMTNGALIGGFWLCMPYADPGLRMIVVMFHCSVVTGEVLGVVQRRASHRPIAYAPITLPLSSALYYAAHWERWSLLLIVFLVSYAIVVRQLGHAFQGSVDRVHTARQAAEAALVQVAAERDAKTRFLASASHDLGQPLQAARLFFDQAIRGANAAQRTAAAGKVTWALDATEQLLRRMLDHLRLESGAVAAEMGPVAVGPLIARVAEMNEPAARLAGVSLHALPSGLQAAADPALAERALGNLVANAIRHGKARKVLVGARRRAGRVRLWVIDDGTGVAAADAPGLFQDYVQGSNHGEEIRGGFGLGLASARRMAELMDGGVGFEAKWAAGAAFWLELNAAEAKAS